MIDYETGFWIMTVCFFISWVVDRIIIYLIRRTK